MALTQARTMPGVMELLPLDQIAFQQMLDTIRSNFERFGFLPIETPVMEFSDVLLTKQGGETERQVYFVQSTGALAAADKGAGDKPELALRFDLTVPLARYVAEHENQLTFPFRRYQIQRVYRGERAQRGRFREFYQCDIDVIGKDSLSIRYDAEMPAVIYSVFRDLDIGPFTIWLNNRKLLRGFLESVGITEEEAHELIQAPDPLVPPWDSVKSEAAKSVAPPPGPPPIQTPQVTQTMVLREVDKLDKVGVEAVRNALLGEKYQLDGDVVGRILSFMETRSYGHADAIAKLDGLGGGNPTFEEGVAELREVLGLIKAFGVPETHYAINLSIARGLDYYTGMVYETTLNTHPQIGSICSGGRYDNLATNYTKSHLPGVGISIGATRLFWQLREAKLLGASDSTVKVLVTQMDEAQLPAYLELAALLRTAGIATEVVLEGGKLGKQFKYADRAGIRFVLVLGTDELAKGVVTVKDMRKQDQFEVPRAELVKALRVELEQAEAMK
ncbi:MAG TPA: HisS family protein [Rudaea sp.]|nr:HisS family protein [Rudaea sp.]